LHLGPQRKKSTKRYCAKKVTADQDSAATDRHGALCIFDALSTIDPNAEIFKKLKPTDNCVSWLGSIDVSYGVYNKKKKSLKYVDRIMVVTAFSLLVFKEGKKKRA